MVDAHKLQEQSGRGDPLESRDRFEILVTPENGDGVHNHIVKLLSNKPEKFDLEAKHIPHIESAISLLKQGHGDIVAVSGKWWYENKESDLSAKLVLPRREPTRVLVGENKPEYLPKSAIIVVDSEVVKRQLLRFRNDLKISLTNEIEISFKDELELVSHLENMRLQGEIDSYVTTRSLYSSLGGKSRRHTLGLQKNNEERTRFIPVPLEGYTVLLTRQDFPGSKLNSIIDVGATLSFRLEMTVLDNIPQNMHDKVGLYIEQRKLGALLREANKAGDEFALREISIDQKKHSENKTRIELFLETINKDGTVTASVDRVFTIEESHSALVTALKDWTQIIDILMEKPTEEKRGRMKEIMDIYIQTMIEQKRISEDDVFDSKLDESDFE